MKHLIPFSHNFIILFSCTIFLLFFRQTSQAQVDLRDTTISWQHFDYELNPDYSLKSYSTTTIKQVTFEAKIIENELIKLIIVPSFGGRVLSFIYKPTNHEYLYESKCGSPYGINQGNFYYNWLMVWGGIFPTFPEPEHGKTWLVPFNYSVLKNTTDTVRISMDYTDNKSYSSTPGSFNNGITNITCTVEVAVFKGSSLWDFNVKLKNNNNTNQKYEYWTCTTLTPGSVRKNTASPLSSEIVVPITQYKAAWSPNNWIGSNGSVYDFSRINTLGEWTDMGIGYAHNFTGNYWGVINHDNEEGVFRLSDNLKTPGMKLWTWGKNSVNGNVMNFSNGALFNYIELWAGASSAFFTDATLAANQTSSWKESYTPTIGLTQITKMNSKFAANLLYDAQSNSMRYQLNAFQPNETYQMHFYLDGISDYTLKETSLIVDKKGLTESFSMQSMSVPNGNYQAHLKIYDSEGILLFDAEAPVNLTATSAITTTDNSIKVVHLTTNQINIVCTEFCTYGYELYNINGQLIDQNSFSDLTYQLQFPNAGIYIIQVKGTNGSFYKGKIIVRD